ncbi:MAG: hypothetical protein ACRES6_01060 [Steroidobacteraceae bacterium]
MSANELRSLMAAQIFAGLMATQSLRDGYIESMAETSVKAAKAIEAEVAKSLPTP